MACRFLDITLSSEQNEFFKSLATNLRLLRKLDEEKRQETECSSDVSLSDMDDDDYMNTSRSKRRKT